MPELTPPSRYEAVARLGKGGGGEVWAVRDKYTSEVFALKVLAAHASPHELSALVREAVALSGLEGLGVPRVVRFGRMPESGRPYLVRELVAGVSLDTLLRKRNSFLQVLSALAQASDKLTLLHRAGLLHGDVKPANVIVGPDGRATLVDLGLAAPFWDEGAEAEGLTPKYAAPELLKGGALTVRAEVYALGAALAEAMKEGVASVSPELARRLATIVDIATADEPDARYPSADEFAAALRLAAQISNHEEPSSVDLLWPIVGIDSTSAQLLEQVERLEPGTTLLLAGPPGAGKSALLRRLAWSLGVRGRPLVWIDEELVTSPASIAAELKELGSLEQAFILVDDAYALDGESVALLQQGLEQGARLVSVDAMRGLETPREFSVPRLEPNAAFELVRRAIPSLTDKLLKQVVEASDHRPGELRRLVRALASEAVASTEDMERVLKATRGVAPSVVPEDPLERVSHYLDRGRYNEAETALANAPESPERGYALTRAVLKARLELGKGETAHALSALGDVESLVDRRLRSRPDKLWQLYAARAHVGTGNYAHALSLAEALADEAGPVGAEARAYAGLALSYLGRHDDAEQALVLASSAAEAQGDLRVRAIALAGLGLVLQRMDRLDDAREKYELGIEAAERASDAGTLATVQLNLASLLKVSGDIAGAINHFEAAVDMGRRSGRKVTVRQALLNLANTDLYLGRLARARASIEALGEQRGDLPKEASAQLYGLEAELAARTGQLAAADRSFEQCANAYEALGRGLDMAEARLERVVVASRSTQASLSELRSELALAERALGDSPAHRPLSSLARARIAWLAADEDQAKRQLDDALASAKSSGQREWIWRALEARAELLEGSGQMQLAKRDREEALLVLEEIALKLPRDLREVYWNDPRRRQLRAWGKVSPATNHDGIAIRTAIPGAAERDPSRRFVAFGTDSELTPLERRLSRILEINSELAGVHDVERLTARVIDCAVDLLRAERGFLLLLCPDGSLSVHTSRSRLEDDPHLDFSRSIAARVIEAGEPVVTSSARDDARMNAYPSVHQLMLQSVACVPILAPSKKPIGALYLETRLRKGVNFEPEIETLKAFGDQVAIALENARLINENRARAEELLDSNSLLEQAQLRLEELLEDRTLRLKRARKQLRETRDTLYGHFGYLGLVGTSAAMRRVYALIERIKDADVPVLITGESGTGKEVVARAIHGASPREKSQFLGVNCGAIPEHLLEAELFGHVKGAYTGANRDRKGLFREAAGGSILLDEIGEMPHKMQAGLLRVLQDRRVRPVGGTTEEPVDVRLMFATNRDLSRMVQEKTFREDLYYRIHVVEVALPPLRERAEDIPQLVDHFLGIFSARYRRDRKSVSRDAMRKLRAFSWPGNVRQLEHVLLNAWVLSDDSEMEVDDFDLPGSPRSSSRVEPAAAPEARTGRSERTSRPAGKISTTSRLKSRLSQHRSDERERILKALQACNWNRVKAAEMSGIPRRTFYRRLREYGIQ